MGPHGAPQCPWGPPGRAESGPLATGMVMVKRVERLLRNYTLRWSHRSSTPHSLGAISTPYNNKSLGPFFEAVSVDAAAARLRRGLHRRPKAAHRRARWCSSQLPPCSRRLVPHATAVEVHDRQSTCHARSPLVGITSDGRRRLQRHPSRTAAPARRASKAKQHSNMHPKRSADLYCRPATSRREGRTRAELYEFGNCLAAGVWTQTGQINARPRLAPRQG